MISETPTVNTVAPLRNVSLLSDLVQRVSGRETGLPGIGCFYGPSGYGKSFAAIYATNKHRCYYVQCRSVWTKKDLPLAVLKDMGIQPASRIADMVRQIGSELHLSQRPLIIDEADFLVQKSLIEVVRDIYEECFGTVILIGEELLPQKLKPFERVHGRILDWKGAQPAAIADAKHLTGLRCRGIEVGEDLLAALHEASSGSVRRICVNLDRVREAAEAQDLARIGLAQWKELKLDFFTGNPPGRRSLAGGAL